MYHIKQISKKTEKMEEFLLGFLEICLI